MTKFVLISDVAFPRSIGGVEKWLSYFSRELTKYKYNVNYLNNVNISLTKKKVKYIGFGQVSKLSNRNRNRSIFNSILFATKVLIWLIKNIQKSDIIYVHQTPLFTLFAVKIVQKLKMCKVFVEWIEVWNLDTWHEEFGKILGKIGFCLQFIVLNLNKNVVTASNLVYNQLKKNKKFNLIKIPGQFIHEAPKINFKKITKSKKKGQFIIVSRLSKEKNVIQSIKIFNEIVNEFEFAKLIIVGKGNEKNNISKQISKFKLGKKIKYYSKISDTKLNKLYLSSEFLLHLSRREGFGLVVGESSSYGVIPIVLHHPQNESIHRVRDFGIVLNTLDEKKSAKKITNIFPFQLERSRKAYEYYKVNLKFENYKYSTKYLLQEIENQIK